MSGARNYGQTGLPHRLAGDILVSHHANDFRRRADENDAAGFADFGKIGAFGKESVAGMNCVRIGDLGGADDGRNIQIAFTAWRRTDTDSLIRKTDVQGMLVGLGIYGNCGDAQLLAGAYDAECNLTPIGNQHFSKHRGP